MEAACRRIAFDHQAFCRRPYTGISRYIIRLAEELGRLDGVTTQIFAPWHVNALLNSSSLAKQTARYLPWHPRISRPFIRQVSGIMGRSRLARWQPQLVHETYYQCASSAPPSIPVVLTVHDMIHERFPGQFAFHEQTLKAKARAIARADILICGSLATANDLRHYFPETEQRIRIVPYGVDQPKVGPVGMRSKAAEPSFLLYVGERRGYKNFDKVLAAFASSGQLRRNWQLICCGGGAFSSHERRTLSKLGLLDAVHQLTPSDASLDQLYRSATALLYPSLCEGFGLPLLEAMARGCPVLASNVNALREVAGDAARFFEPTDHHAIRDAIEWLTNAPAEAQRLRAAGLRRVRHFSWSRCARGTLACYREIMQ